MVQVHLTDNARRIFDLRYARKDADGNPTETPEQAIRRVAQNVASVTALYPRLDDFYEAGDIVTNDFPFVTAKRQWLYLLEKDQSEFRNPNFDEVMRRGHGRAGQQAARYEDMISRLDFLPNSPTWTGAGTPLGQLAACFVLPVEDDLVSGPGSIFDTLKDAVAIQQTGGGNGFSFGKLRPNGDLVKRSMGKASGPMGFARAYDSAFEEIAQGGCLLPSTMVQTSVGLLRLDELVDVERQGWQSHELTVLTDEGERSSPRGWNNGIAEVVTVRTSSGLTITGTPDHKVKILTDQGPVWRSMGELCSGDSIMQMLGQHQGFEVPLIPPDRQHGNQKMVRVPDRLNEDLGFFLGYLMGDGFVASGEHDHRVGVSVAHDSYLMEEMPALFHRLFGVTPHVSQKPNDRSVTFMVDNRSLKDFLVDNGLATKRSSHDIDVPRPIRQSEMSVVGAFLRGLQEADGTVSHGYPQIGGMVCERFIHQVAILMTSLGMPVKVWQLSPRGGDGYGDSPQWAVKAVGLRGLEAWRKRIGCDVQSRFQQVMSWEPDEARTSSDLLPCPRWWVEPVLHAIAIDGCGIDSQRGTSPGRGKRSTNPSLRRDLMRYLRGERTFGESAYRRLMGHDEFADHARDVGDLWFTEVVSVDSHSDEVLTLDLEVDDNHTYLANGMVVHNTRRGANMLVLPVSHPDVREFINSKTVEGDLSQFNISVAITDEFMQAVEKDGEFDLVHNGKVYETVQARELYDEIVQNAWVIGDPGNLFIDRANKDNPVPTRYRLEATNPCVTGETLVAVADGRGAVPIRELAEAGEDVLVYTFNPETDEVEVARGYHPRLTGEGREVYEVVLEDGSSYRVTGDHKFILRDGGERAAVDLAPGDRLQPFTRYWSSYTDTKNRYWFIQSGQDFKRVEHRLIAGYLMPGVEVVHHADFDGLNNHLDNLVPMTAKQHTVIHDFSGERNPMYGKISAFRGRKHSEAAKRAISEANTGWIPTPAQRQRMSVAAQARANDPVVKMCEYCGDTFAVAYGRREQGYCSRVCSNIAIAHREDVYKSRMVTRAKSRGLKREQQVETFLDLRSELGRDPLKKEWEKECRQRKVSSRLQLPSSVHQGPFRTYAELKEAALVHNHRVVSVAPVGREDVYNITVEGHHNFAIVSEKQRQSKDGITLSGVFTTQCGEQWLGPYENCCLGSIAVSNFASWDGTFDWERFRETVVTATEFLDDVVDANQYVAAVPELEVAAQGGRRIGLGLMGLADAMLMLGIRYGSAEALHFASNVTEFARYHAMLTSIERAKERGSFEWIEGSIYDPALHRQFGPGAEVTLANTEGEMVSFNLWSRPTEIMDEELSPPPSWITEKPDWSLVEAEIAEHGIRNSCQFTFAPTGTISNVAGLEGSGCEPLFALTYTRKVMQDGQNISLSYASPLFQEALEYAGVAADRIEIIVAKVAANGGSCQGIDEVPPEVREVFVVAADVSPEDHVWSQATLQRFVDNSISKTINLSNDATPEDVSAAYKLAYDLGCKGITVYRQGSRMVEVLTTGQEKPVDEWPTVHPKKIPHYAADRGLAGRVYPIESAFGKIQATITELEAHPGRPFDVRLQVGKAGSDKGADVEAIGRMISLSLRSGVAVADIVDQLEGIGGQSFHGFGDRRVKSVADGVAKLFARYYLDYQEMESMSDNSVTVTSVPLLVDTSQVCPKCHNATLVMESGCRHCDVRLGGCGQFEGCD